MSERSLAKCSGFDIMIEDHGILVMDGHFDYEEGTSQGLGYCIDTSFLYRFLGVFGVRHLHDVNGKSCWVTHTNGSIEKLEPLHKSEGTPMIMADWSAFVDKLHLPSPYEMRTGKKP